MVHTGYQGLSIMLGDGLSRKATCEAELSFSPGNTVLSGVDFSPHPIVNEIHELYFANTEGYLAMHFCELWPKNRCKTYLVVSKFQNHILDWGKKCRVSQALGAWIHQTSLCTACSARKKVTWFCADAVRFWSGLYVLHLESGKTKPWESGKIISVERDPAACVLEGFTFWSPWKHDMNAETRALSRMQFSLSAWKHPSQVSILNYSEETR